jgi:hypothetical protein
MLLLLILFILVSGCGVATSTLGMGIHYFCLGSVLWMYLEVWQLAVELSCCDCVEILVSRENVAFPHWARTIIIQNLQILQHDSADTGSLPMEYFLKNNSSYFQKIQPGSSGGGRLYC